jgi:hypothetical protein
MLLRRCGDDLAQHLPQDGGVIRQGVKIDLHAMIMNNAPASLPAFNPCRRAFLPGQFGPAGVNRSAPLAAL